MMEPDRVSPEVEELLPDYLADARECLEKVNRVLLALDLGKETPESVPELFRQMHIIKGGAGLMGFGLIEAVAHAAEDLLGAVKRSELPFSKDLASPLLSVHDNLRALLEELEGTGQTSTDPEAVLEVLRIARTGESVSGKSVTGGVGEPAGEDPGTRTPPGGSEAAARCDSFVEESDEVLQEFFVESGELLDELDQDLVSLEERQSDDELLNKIFRAAHTLKGSSSFLGFEAISGVTHRVEDLFNKLRRGEMALTSEIMDVILEAIDRVRRLLEAAREGREGPPVDDVLASLRATLGGGEIASGRGSGGGEVPGATANAVPKATERDEASAVSPPEKNPTARESVERSLRDHRRTTPTEQTIRVDVERLDALMNLVGELVLGKNRLAQLRGQMEERWEGESLVEELGETAGQIDLVASDLQLAVMKTRLVPIDKVFRKFPRMVRDLSRSLQKEIRLEIHGENTELDKSVVEVIGDPLVHLIRNAADHGVELPETREAAGKPREGRIRLSACHEGNHIVVSIEDDGKGMDPEVLKSKAVEKGIVSNSEAASMGPREAFNLIFAPGFSTAASVSSVSGRGVGMDVVKTNIQQLNGLIEVDSAPGRGTRVDVRIPLTLAIIQALLVRSRDEVYAVPLVSVVETVRIGSGDVKSLDGFPVLRLRNQVVPLLRLDSLYRVGGERPQGGEREYVVVLGLAEKRVGLVVDALVGEEEVVIKSLGGYLSDTPGVAGATIRGDGRVTLIVDVNEILEIATRERGGRVKAA